MRKYKTIKIIIMINLTRIVGGRYELQIGIGEKGKKRKKRYVGE